MKSPAGSRLPAPLRSYVLDFEERIEKAVVAFASRWPAGSRILDAGAGEGAYARHFQKHRYIGVDRAIGDAQWDYSRLDVIGDVLQLPFPDRSFDAALSIVTLEHVRDPRLALSELARVLRPGGELLLAVPHEWEVHQHPHDYFRFTRFGVEHLAVNAGMRILSLIPAGGYFRLLSRRLLSGYQFCPLPLAIVWLILAAPAALLLPLLDARDSRKDFTLGYIAILRNDGE
jgi:SAM-dependent methyltransferase